jgi:predicted DsbA family dithiol-disulfide isomerase
MASDTRKKLIQIDVSSDTVCPWCFVGKKNLEKAMEQSKGKFDFEVSLPFSNLHHDPVSELLFMRC